MGIIFIFVFFTKYLYYWGDEIKQEELGGEWETDGGEMHAEF